MAKKLETLVRDHQIKIYIPVQIHPETTYPEIPGFDFIIIFVASENLEKSFKSLKIKGKTKTKSMTGVANWDNVISS